MYKNGEREVINTEHGIPKILYKYRGLSGKNREYFRQTLLENRVWFSSPADFNDPFDCRVHGKFEGNSEEIRRYANRLLKKASPEMNKYQRRVKFDEMEKRSKDPEVQGRIIADLQRDVNKLGIFCLSACRDDILMWSYYAGQHAGLCLGFAHKHGPGTLGVAQKVEYADEFPEVNYFMDDHIRLMSANLLTKAKAWSHEQEWGPVVSALAKELWEKKGVRFDKVAHADAVVEIFERSEVSYPTILIEISEQALSLAAQRSREVPPVESMISYDRTNRKMAQILEELD